MNRIKTRLGKAVAGILMLALAGATTAQTTAPGTGAGPLPGLPTGHPSLEQMLAAQAAKAGATTNPDAANPHAGGMPAGVLNPHAGGMPAGTTNPHAGNPHGGMDMSKAATGTVEVQLVQGTAGGPALGKMPVKLKLTMHGMELGRGREFESDEKGLVKFEGVPVPAAMELVLLVNHGGVEQTLAGTPITPDEPNPKVQFKVYETTDQKPAWTITMRHVNVGEWNAEGAQVMEMLRVKNPTDRIWIGESQGDKRVTMELTVPSEVNEINPDAQLYQGGQFSTGKLATATPLYPGERVYTYQYVMPVKDARLQIPIASPADVEQLRVFLPEDATKVTAPGLQSTGSVAMGEGEPKVRRYEASNVKAGTALTLTVSGVGAGPEKSAWSAKNVAVGGTLIVVVGGAILMLLKPRKNKKDTPRKTGQEAAA